MDYVNFDLQGFLLLTACFLVAFIILVFAVKPEKEETQNENSN